VVHQHSTGASGITRVENPRAESTKKSTKVERAKYPVRFRYSRDFRVPGGEDSALESASNVPLLDKILPTLSKLQNTKVVVAGYTDNVPIWASLRQGLD
jgi:outer membrane protein OmpA-like peptidoglycan-associated protein